MIKEQWNKKFTFEINIIYRSNRGTFTKKVSFFAFFMDFKEKAEKEKKKQYLDISVENIRIEIVSFTDSNYMLI